MTKDEALKLALEALEIRCGTNAEERGPYGAITAIREALAQPEQICGLDVVLDESMPPNTFKLAQPEHSPNCALLKIPSKDCDCQDQQEPVAWANLNALSEQINSVNCGTVYRLPSEAEKRQPLYTTPPQRTWVGLTQQDIDIAFDDTQEGGGFWEFARAIEAKLKEKNT